MLRIPGARPLQCSGATLSWVRPVHPALGSTLGNHCVHRQLSSCPSERSRQRSAQRERHGGLLQGGESPSAKGSSIEGPTPARGSSPARGSTEVPDRLPVKVAQ